LILTADAGFGHRRAATAVEDALKERYGDVSQVSVINPLQDPDVPSLIKRIETDYDAVVVEDPTLYMLAYHASDAPLVTRLIQDVTTALLNDTMSELIAVHRPDVIVTTYPAFTQAALDAMDRADHQAKLDVIVTDLVGVHSLWFNPRADYTFVPTGQVYKQALDKGLDKARVRLTGLPVHPDFAREARDPTTLRAALGWKPDLTTALIVGSPRSPEAPAIARLLDRSGLPLQLAVVIGGSPEMEEELARQRWKGTVHTYGMIKNMAELMHAADFIVCKAGGLIVSEALACGLPLILHEALPGQEAGNARYVVDSGAGAWSPGPIGVLTTAYAWLSGDQAELKKRRAAAQKTGKPRAAYDIAEIICRQVCGTAEAE
jgi:1,2-diacylglycerol 3-beta-galactosyltransferase